MARTFRRLCSYSFLFVKYLVTFKATLFYKRKQVKTNAQRLARHRVKRGDIGFDEALADIAM